MDGDGIGQRGATTLEDAHLHPARESREGQPQRGRRRLAGKAIGAQQDEGRGVFFGSQLQAAQGTHVGIDKPQQDDVTGAGRKGLTRGPAGMGCAGRLDEEQTLDLNSGALDGRHDLSDDHCEFHGLLLRILAQRAHDPDAPALWLAK